MTARASSLRWLRGFRLMVIRPLFGSMGVIFLLMIPVVSMRLFAEEKKSGTAELLFTHSDIVGAPLPRALTTTATFPQEQALAAQAVLALVAWALAVRSPKAAVVSTGCGLLLPLATGHSGTAGGAVVTIVLFRSGPLSNQRAARPLGT